MKQRIRDLVYSNSGRGAFRQRLKAYAVKAVERETDDSRAWMRMPNAPHNGDSRSQRQIEIQHYNVRIVFSTRMSRCTELDIIEPLSNSKYLRLVLNNRISSGARHHFGRSVNQPSCMRYVE